MRGPAVAISPLWFLLALPFLIIWYLMCAVVLVVAAIAVFIDEIALKPLRRRYGS